MSVEVSFIIPHMGREGMLLDTLKSISQLRLDGISIEIIVVTKNRSLNEDTVSAAKPIPLNIVHAPQELTISDQRNFGVEKSNGRFLAFLDADIALNANWLSALLPILDKQKDIKLVSAIQKPADNAPALEKLRVALSNAEIDCDVAFLPGRNLLLSRLTFDVSGGFPSHLVTCEDYVFTQKVSQQGRLFYSSASDYVHIGEDKAFFAMAKKEVWRGLSNIASLRGRKIPLREWPSFIVPPVFLLLLLLSLFAALLNAWSLALFSLFASMCIPLLYSLRLRRLTKGDPSFFTIFMFYLFYFPARAIGTIGGIFKGGKKSER
uniref:glycosyltransferase n=1 Tax=Ningiella ruwaisensis TaxID=2364274 RepID=UPI00109FD852|nr:glycosyltransferase family 2 protein [Ningiella ruwaisensis]